MRIWKFGIVGAGLIADFHAKSIQNLENASLIGICGSNTDKARRLAEKYNCKTFENQAIHMIDLLQHLMGPVDSLQAYTATLGHSIEVEDTGVAVLRFRNNALGVITVLLHRFRDSFAVLKLLEQKELLSR